MQANTDNKKQGRHFTIILLHNVDVSLQTKIHASYEELGSQTNKAEGLGSQMIPHQCDC